MVLPGLDKSERSMVDEVKAHQPNTSQQKLSPKARSEVFFCSSFVHFIRGKILQLSKRRKTISQFPFA